MSLIIFRLIYLFLTKISLQSSIFALSADIKTHELGDITLLLDEFPSIIEKIEQTVNRYRCPKGWKRVGISCYYLSNITSTSIHANYTCNLLHSNLSNLIQIKNTIQLFYAAHLLIKNNLSSLIINIHPNLLQDFLGKPISQILSNDQQQWQQIKEKFYQIKIKYEKLKVKIVRQLASAGFKILRRTKKIIQNEIDYNEIDFTDENDTFDEIENIHNICDRIDWNIRNNNATTFILITYIELDKTICSLSDVDNDRKYNIVCEYVLDFCLGNIICGKHGQCMNIIGGFECSCSFLYGGLLCEKISQQGRQILISCVIIIILAGLSLKPVQQFLWLIMKLLIKILKICRKVLKRNDQKGQIINFIKLEQIQIKISEHKKIRIPHSLSSPIKHNIIRDILVGFLSILVLSFLFIMITIRYYKLFQIDRFDHINLEILVNHTFRLIKQCEHISDYRRGHIIFAPFALLLILIFSYLTKRRNSCLNISLISPIEPFRIENRFITATVFGILTYEVLKIFEELLFRLDQTFIHGVLIELLVRIGTIILVGFRYYPILASLHLHNVIARFLACLYIIGDVGYTIIREGSCMGFLLYSRQYTAFEEAKLRLELGTWFIVYGLIKYTPHFFFLSYLTAELFVRFAYDSIYVPIKMKKSIWTMSDEETNESKMAKFYVTKLFRRKLIMKNNTNKNCQQYFRKFLKFIFKWQDDIYCTTMVICTYTVASIFLYYLACTFVFLYLSRITEYISFINSYIPSSINIKLKESSSLKLEIIVSAILTVIIYGFQLFFGIQRYKRFKKDLYLGKNLEIPSIKYFEPNSIASNSVHYSGFLVGYLAWGFVICFHLILLITIAIKIVSLQIRHIEIILTIIVPIFIIYFLKMFSIKLMGKFLFTHKPDEGLILKNYTIFIYFSFFADCFLGIASCIIRLIKTIILNTIFMARLDYSFLGKPLEKFDTGFAAYISHLHMEVNHSHPIKLG
ncbi:unnamed protein product [Adineta steineri]|uniref:EGF-like domain-containing protein n=1 Tax=Adineta steineri TaxID=433720 RepID=A0A815X502_9BILA|nr:unnamed protein product [Adineta steineri]CAF1549868.1 unnamed protein product [Adineta steineri]